MTPLQILSTGGVASGELELTPGLAAQQIKPHLIHEVVTQELAARRGGNAETDGIIREEVVAQAK